jgi:hypothetical protein
MRVSSNFQHQFSEDTKRDFNKMEIEVRRKRQQLTKEKLEAYFKYYIPDLGYSRTIYTKKKLNSFNYIGLTKILLCKLLRKRVANKRPF